MICTHPQLNPLINALLLVCLLAMPTRQSLADGSRFAQQVIPPRNHIQGRDAQQFVSRFKKSSSKKIWRL